ncbi:MAG TPA: DHHA1 domain-containing protein [Acidobacteriaceae bacterium]|nr:DHHA1 domain-containing protein [Acidobacteriaceae bacterium]
MFAGGQLRKLPSRAGDLRIIEIAEFDRNACGGTHVRSTGQIGGLYLRSTEKVKQGIRVEFVCGQRAVRAAREDFLTLTNAARQFSVHPAETPDAIGRLLADAKAISKQTQALTGELLRYRAQELVRDTPLLDGWRCVQLQLHPPEVPDSRHAKLLVSKLIAEGEKTAAVASWSSQESKDAPATVILGRSRDLAFDCGAVLKEILARFGGRGGGTQDLAQGSAEGEHLQPALEAIRLKLGALPEPRI